MGLNRLTSPQTATNAYQHPSYHSQPQPRQESIAPSQQAENDIERFWENLSPTSRTRFLHFMAIKHTGTMPTMYEPSGNIVSQQQHLHAPSRQWSQSQARYHPSQGQRMEVDEGRWGEGAQPRYPSPPPPPTNLAPSYLPSQVRPVSNAHPGPASALHGRSSGKAPMREQQSIAPPSREGNFQLLVLNKVQGFEDRLDEYSRVQTSIAENLDGVSRSLKNLSIVSSLTPQKGKHSFSESPARSVQRSARGSRSMAARINLARLQREAREEHEDFTTQLAEVSSDEDDASMADVQPQTAPSNAQKPTAFGTQPMPDVAGTTSKEEALLVAAMTPRQREDVEGTFIKRLQEAVRKHLLFLLRIPCLEDIGEAYPALSDEEYKAWVNGTAVYFTRRENFRICCKRGWVRDKFNRAANEFFVRHFLECAAGGGTIAPGIHSRYLVPQHVEAALKAHMDHVRQMWREQANPRDVEAVEKRRRQKQNSSRQKTTLICRSYVVAIYGLLEHVLMFTKLAPVHMSGDEAESEEARRKGMYVIIEAEWQSKDFKNFVRSLDERYLDDWDKGVGNRKRGRPPRQRYTAVSKPYVVDSVAPVGLWRNCYDLTWLHKQPAWIIRELDIIDEDYNFTINWPNATISEQKANELQREMVGALAEGMGEGD
uniref:Thiol-transferase Tc52 n=1 Tax=Ganoderma boninense TaxID=34458 RepID=A0A5K1JYU2_9APHY